MDGQKFDNLAKLAANGMTRRRALRGLGGFAAAATGFLALRQSGDAQRGVRLPCYHNCLSRCRRTCKTAVCRHRCPDICERRCDND